MSFLRRQSNIYITYIYNVSWDGFCNVRCNGYSIGWKSLGFSYWAFGRWQFLGMCRSDGCLWWYYKSSDNCLEAGWTGFDGFDLQLCLFMDNCCLLWVKRNFPCFRICVWRLVSCLLLSFCFFLVSRAPGWLQRHSRRYLVDLHQDCGLLLNFLENNSRNIWLERIFSIPLHTLCETSRPAGSRKRRKERVLWKDLHRQRK